MKIYTYMEACEKFASVLDTAAIEGEVVVERQNGQLFVIRPDTQKISPLAVKGIEPFLTTDELIGIIRQQRENIRK